MVHIAEGVIQRGTATVLRDLDRPMFGKTGTNTGPGGTGRPVRISGYEEWTFGPDGLVARSLGHFDAAEYQRQVDGTPAP